MGFFSKKPKPDVRTGKSEVYAKNKNRFYVFEAKGEGIGSAISMAGGAIGFGVKNADAWKEQLLNAYPDSRKMEFILIGSTEWKSPDVGFLNKDKPINFKPYLAAIKKHLTEKMGFSAKEANSLVSVTENNNLAVADFWDGAIRFGVPIVNDDESKKGGKKSGAVKLDALIKGKGGRCPHCNAELQPIIDNEAQPVYDHFKKLGPIAGMVTMDTAREQIINAGLACNCGEKINNFAK